MPRDWSDVPDEVRDAISKRIGTVKDVKPSPISGHLDFVANLTTTNDRLLVKGVVADPKAPAHWSLRQEIRISPFVQPTAPKLLWHLEAEGWLVAGFEHIQGRHPDYRPESPDLAYLAAALRTLQGTLTPPGMTLPVESRWDHGIHDLAPLHGDGLLHTHLDPHSLLVTRTAGARIVDWGHTARGASWLESAMVIPWLIQAGHTPAGADAWLGQFSTWRAASDTAVHLFSEVNAAEWARTADKDPTQRSHAMARATRIWWEYSRDRRPAGRQY